MTSRSLGSGRPRYPNSRRREKGGQDTPGSGSTLERTGKRPEVPRTFFTSDSFVGGKGRGWRDKKKGC